MVLDHGAAGAEFFDFFFWVGEWLRLFGLRLDDGVTHFDVAIILRERRSSGGGCRGGAGESWIGNCEKGVCCVVDVFSVLLASCLGWSRWFTIIASLGAKKVWCS